MNPHSLDVDGARPKQQDRTQEGRSAHKEIELILDAVPQDCRGDATWAVPLLLSVARGNGMTHSRRIAYLLATAHHSARFGANLVEVCPTADQHEKARFFACYEPGTPLGNARGNIQTGDGERFCGRGFVPIAGRSNYVTWSHRLELPARVIGGKIIPFFIDSPDAMARPDIAARTLVSGMRDGIFTGNALGTYVNDRKTDYYNARRVIGDMAAARHVAALADRYYAAIAEAAAEQPGLKHPASPHTTDQLATCDLLAAVDFAVERLAGQGERLPPPCQVVDWNGEARHGKFVQLDVRTCVLHVGRGIYITLDIQRDLNGIVPAEGKNVSLKRSGHVRSTVGTDDR